MYLARIEGTLTATVRHQALAGCKLLIGRRVETNGRAAPEPIVLLDRLGARRGSIVMVSTDGASVRRRLGNTAPARLEVVGLVDRVNLAPGVATR
jgi:microcompartment protein CcmK/EutM